MQIAGMIFQTRSGAYLKSF
ncbi:MAG: DUF6783 domain-containing protein [Blautia faecis]